jgi:hypothetical protein
MEHIYNCLIDIPNATLENYHCIDNL